MEELEMAFQQIDLSQMLYEILKTREGDLTFANGEVRRIFLDSFTREAVIETASGQTDYALDAGVDIMNKAIEAYKAVYPNEYDAFIKEYRNRLDEISLYLNEENINRYFGDDIETN